MPPPIKPSAAAIGYCLQGGSSANLSPADGATYYIGATFLQADTVEGKRRQRIPKAGTIKVAYLEWLATLAAGTNESITVAIRLNATTDTTIATIGDTNAEKVFSNTGLSIAVIQGDFFEVKISCPTWATNPTGVALSYVVYIE